MSTEDPTQSGLRVGGWLPPFREFLSEGDPGSATPPTRVEPAAPIAELPAGAADARHARPGTGLLVCATVMAVAMSGLTMTFLWEPGSRAAAPNGMRFYSGPVLPAIPFDPADATPTATPDPPGTVQVTAERRSEPKPAITRTRTGAKVPATAPAKPQNPAVDPTISLGPRARGGHRARHRHFGA